MVVGGEEVAGPFTVVWEGCDEPEWARPGAVWKRHERTVATEAEAVALWESAQLYENTRPVSISPEPNWNRYSYGGHTPTSR